MRGSLLAFAASLAVLAGTVSQARLVAPGVSDEVITGAGMPRSLDEYGFFLQADAQVPAQDVIPYELNTPLYSDGADKLRFIYVPDGEVLQASGDGLLQFPVGSAIIKTFAFGTGEDRRLIETRVLLHRADGWLALPYRWNIDQSEAKLALAGARVQITRPDGMEISYRIPNKNQCKTCHGKDGEVIPIGPKARNLPNSWKASMMRNGDLQGLDPQPDAARYSVGGANLPDWTSREGLEVEVVARAYLDVNCAHCHQPGGSASNSGLDLRWEQGDPHAIGIRKPPVAAGRGSGGHAVSIAPGDPDASILVHRMSTTEPGIAMPELGKSTVDEEGVAALREWIEGMPTS